MKVEVISRGSKYYGKIAKVVYVKETKRGPNIYKVKLEKETFFFSENEIRELK